MIDIICPFKMTDNNGLELKFMLRSLDKNFVGDYKVTIYGEEKPDWVNNKINWIDDYPKVVGDKETRLYAILNDILNSDIDKFLWLNDDICFLKETVLNDYISPRAYRVRKSNKIPNVNGWFRKLRHTTYTLEQKFGETNNYETHLPYLFNTKKMKELLTMYDFSGGEFLWASMYFKHFYAGELIRTEDKLSIFGVKRNNITYLEAEHKWLNYDNRGFSKDVQTLLFEKFPEKSRFEC